MLDHGGLPPDELPEFLQREPDPDPAADDTAVKRIVIALILAFGLFLALAIDAWARALGWW